MATRKLLLADDSVTIQKVVNLIFADKGIDVTSVGDGDSAVEKLEEVSPDIVLVDVHMPGLTGYQVCEHIKTSSRFSHTPVILLVGSFEPFDEDEARRVGADDVVTKPLQSIGHLVGRVNTLLSPQADRVIDRESVTQPLSSAFLPADSSIGKTEKSVEQTAEGWFKPQQSLADTSVDDELLESTPLSGSDVLETPKTYSGDMRATTRLSAEDLKGFDFESSPKTSANVEDSDAANIFETMPTLKKEDIGVVTAEAPVERVGAVGVEPATVSATGTNSPYSTSSLSDDSILDLTYIETPSSNAFDDEIVLDLEEDYQEIELLAPPPAFVSAKPTAAFAPTITAPKEPAIAPVPPFIEEKAAEPVRTPSVGFEQAKSQEFNFDLSPTPSVVKSDTAPLALSATQSAAQTSVVNAGNLSQESVDAIARRVVEIMSEKVVEEIAWEIVPELADLHIKRKMQEKGL